MLLVVPDPVDPSSPGRPSAGDALRLSLTRVWDADAAGYDASRGHGLTDPKVERVWRTAIERVLGNVRAANGSALRVLDVGTGTGVVALLAAQLGHQVIAIDLSRGMLERGNARAQAMGLEVDFQLGDAETPNFAPSSFDVVISRHVLWTLQQPAAAARAWASLVVPGGTVAVFDVYHPRLALPRRALGVVAERIDVQGRGQSGGHHYTRAQRLALPLAVQRDPSPGQRVLEEAGLLGVAVERLTEIDLVEGQALSVLQRLGRPFRHYLATGQRAAP
jgi:2-polyprenyl-3-methyl-5-hydroxy-6-metoxy-1,4-benzoquinol methylase